MALFCYLEKEISSLNKNYSEFEIVRLGFSFKAFLFSFIWGFSHGLNNYALKTFAIFFPATIFLLNENLSNGFYYFIIFLISLYWGFFGKNILIIYYIEKKRMKPLKLLYSNSLKEAILVIFSEKKSNG